MLQPYLLPHQTNVLAAQCDVDRFFWFSCLDAREGTDAARLSVRAASPLENESPDVVLEPFLSVFTCYKRKDTSPVPK